MVAIGKAQFNTGWPLKRHSKPMIYPPPLAHEKLVVSTSIGIGGHLYNIGTPLKQTTMVVYHEPKF